MDAGGRGWRLEVGDGRRAAAVQKDKQKGCCRLAQSLQLSTVESVPGCACANRRSNKCHGGTAMRSGKHADMGALGWERRRWREPQLT